MIINLPWVEPIDTLDLPENFEELVKKSIREFTRGTKKEYLYKDKLFYLDKLRKAYLRKDNTVKAVDNIIMQEQDYQEEEYGYHIVKPEDVLSVELMERCYKEGFRPFYDHYYELWSDENNETLSVILEIIKIVVNYDEEHNDERKRTVYDFSEYDCAVRAGFIEDDCGNSKKKKENEKRLKEYGFKVYTARDYVEAEKEKIRTYCEDNEDSESEIKSFFYNEFDCTEEEFIERIENREWIFPEDFLFAYEFEIDGVFGIAAYYC